LDAEYQFIGDENILSAEVIYIYERQSLNATLPVDPSNTLRSFGIGGSYFYQRRWGGALGYFSTTGSTNALLYTPAPVSGNNTLYIFAWLAF
jgi:hypothetical protein